MNVSTMIQHTLGEQPMNTNTKIIAHRGASYLASHENTIEAFQIALDIHADMIEFDVRQTLDKVLIIFHDEQINGIPIKTLTYPQLCDISNSMGFHVPTLEETLQHCQHQTNLLIELKEAGYEKKVVSMVNTYFDYSEYSIQSFLDIVVRRVKKIDPQVKAGLLVGLEQADFSTRFNEFFPGRRIAECHADFVSAHFRIATTDFILRMKHAQIPVYVWTSDTNKSITFLLESEVDGIITNRPDLGVYLRSRWEKEETASEEKRAKTYAVLQKVINKIPIRHKQ